MFNYEYPPLGGGGGVAHELIAGELAKRHRIHLITSAYRGLPRQERRDGVHITRVPVVGRNRAAVASLPSMLSYPPSAWLAAKRLMGQERFDVINAYFAIPTGPASLLPAKLGRVPHVTTILGGDIFDPSKRTSPHRFAPARWVVDKVLQHSDAVVAESEDVRDNVYEFYRFRSEIQIIPLAVRKPQIAALSREELGLPEKAIVVVTVGRLVRRKGNDVLIRAMSRLQEDDTHLVIIGSGPERESLESLARELGMASRVRFTGWVEEERKWQLLASADIYASGTLHEGFGLVFLEAMAVGLPVVAPDVGGHLDFLEDGKTGAIVRVGSEDALAEAIAHLAQSPGARQRIGEENQLRFQHFSIEKSAKAYEDLFEQLVSDMEAGVQVR